MQSGDQRGPIPPTPARAQKSNKKGYAKPDISQGDIRLPELERKEAAEEAAKIAEQQKQNPQAPDQEGLNSSGLPSSEVYYKKKISPVHTSVITPIANCRIWIRVISVAFVFFGFFWMKGAVDGLRFHPGTLPTMLHFLELILSFFFFVLPAYKLWILTREIDLLEMDRDESAVASVLYAHARIWQYLGLAAGGAVLFIAISIGLKIASGLISI